MLLEHVAEGLGFEVARQCGVLLVFGILWGQDLYKRVVSWGQRLMVARRFMVCPRFLVLRV